MQSRALTAFRSLSAVRTQQSTFASLVGGRAFSTSATFKLVSPLTLPPRLLGKHTVI